MRRAAAGRGDDPRAAARHRASPLADAESGPLGPHLAWALDAGLLEPFDGPDHRVRLTTRGRLLSNELFARLV